MWSFPAETTAPSLPRPREDQSGPFIAEVRAGDFARHYNRASFLFAHALSGHPLFEWTSLRGLVGRLSTTRSNYEFNVGAVALGNRWDEIGPAGRPLLEVIDSLEHAQAWVILRRVELDAQYGPVLMRCFADLEALVGGTLPGDLTLRKAEIILSSPGRLTNYHLDYETNFLVQVRGEKTFHVFDPADREVLPDHELERYARGDVSGAVYKPHLLERSARYHLRPGVGVHVPVYGPHCATNGPEVSVSIAFNFELRSVERRACVYRCNSYLRQLGLSPAAPGRSALRDSGKRLALRVIHGLSAVRRLVRPGAGH